MDDEHKPRRSNEADELPGRPSKALLRKVRAVLWTNLRSRPHRDDAAWRAAWQWAKACGDMSRGWPASGKTSRVKWPSPNEIASQYLLLVLSEMKSCCAMRLPSNAAASLPSSVAVRFGVKFPAVGPTIGSETPQDLPRLNHLSSNT